MKVQEVQRGKGGKGKGKQRGKKGRGGEQKTTVRFLVPREVNTERLRFRKGDSVIISKGDPLCARQGEGTVLDLDQGFALMALAYILLVSESK